MNTKCKTSSKTQLAIAYGVHFNTISKWLKKIPDLELSTKQRILTPKQVELIYKHLGEP